MTNIVKIQIRFHEGLVPLVHRDGYEWWQEQTMLERMYRYASYTDIQKLATTHKQAAKLTKQIAKELKLNLNDRKLILIGEEGEIEYGGNVGDGSTDNKWIRFRADTPAQAAKFKQRWDDEILTLKLSLEADPKRPKLGTKASEAAIKRWKEAIFT